MRVVACVLSVPLTLCACATPVGNSPAERVAAEPEVNSITPVGHTLESLPPPENQLSVAIYEFRDRTGQRKPKDNVAELSTAVTQGGTQILIDAALRAGDGSWFEVVERAGLQNLLQERQIIRQQREAYMGNQAPALPALVFAGALLEGGIVSFDTNITTGGLGARLLGIGADTEYRTNVVEVFLRLVSVQNGRVLRSVNARKTIYSVRLQGNVFKFIGFEELLEAEAGVTSNEPVNIAVRQAIEAALYGLIVEGAINGDWSFADPEKGEEVIRAYKENRADDRDTELVEAAFEDQSFQ